MRDNRTRTVSILAIVIIITGMIMVTNPISVRASPVEAESELVILAPTSEKYVTPFIESFKEWAETNHGVSLEVAHTRYGSETAVTKVMEWDGSPMADVFLSARTPYFLRLKKGGYLEPYKGGKVSDWWGDIPKKKFNTMVKDPDGYWVSFAMSGFGIIVNTDKLAMEGVDVPKSWADLAKSQYHGLIHTGNPAVTGIAHMILEGILQNRGWEDGWMLYLKIARNTARFSKSSGKAVTLVGKGEYGIALSKDTDWYKKGRKYEALDLIWPEDGNPVVPIAMAQLKGARHPEAAKLLEDYMMSGVGMKRWAEIRMERPIRSDVEIPPGMPPLENIEAEWKTSPYSIELHAARSVEVNYIMAKYILGYHSRIQKADDAKLKKYHKSWIVEPKNTARSAISAAENEVEKIENLSLTKEEDRTRAIAESALELAHKEFNTYCYRDAYKDARKAIDCARAVTGEEVVAPVAPGISIGAWITSIIVVAIVVAVITRVLTKRR